MKSERGVVLESSGYNVKGLVNAGSLFIAHNDPIPLSHPGPLEEGLTLTHKLGT